MRELETAPLCRITTEISLFAAKLEGGVCKHDPYDERIILQAGDIVLGMPFMTHLYHSGWEIVLYGESLYFVDHDALEEIKNED